MGAPMPEKLAKKEIEEGTAEFVKPTKAEKNKLSPERSPEENIEIYKEVLRKIESGNLPVCTNCAGENITNSQGNETMECTDCQLIQDGEDFYPKKEEVQEWISRTEQKIKPQK